MTYNPDHGRPHIPHAGIGDYPNSHDDKSISGKWLLITLAFIVVLFGGLALFAGDAKITVNDGEISSTTAPQAEPESLTPVTD